MCMIKLNILGEEKQFKKGITLYEISKQYKNKYPYMLGTIDNDVAELRKKILDSCNIGFIDTTRIEGMRVYQRGVSFLLVCAVYELFGKNVKVVIQHSIEKNYYCTLEGIEVTNEILNSIENKMRELVESDIEIQKHSVPVDEGMKIMESLGMYDKVNLLKYRRTTNVNFYEINGICDYFYGPMPIKTSDLKYFALRKNDSDFILVFPTINEPNTLVEPKIYNKITTVFKEASNWSKILNIDTVGSLNNVLSSEGVGNIIRTAEALHEKKICEISDMITSRSAIRLVAIAGPSSSGKTTFSERLCIQLRANGIRPRLISLDNYFLEYAPLDEDGNLDYESLEHINVKQLNIDLKKLLDGEEIELPYYNFKEGKPEYRGNMLKLEKGDILLIEGIHGLNSKITESVPKDMKFLIYLSALTQLNIDDHNRIPTSDKRLIRRIVRDYSHRGRSPISTILSRKSVARGEEKYIFPYQENADVIFNSALIYELCVLKPYVEPLLFQVEKNTEAYSEARRLIKFLDCFLTVPSEEIPANSILREFIGGSCFKA